MVFNRRTPQCVCEKLFHDATAVNAGDTKRCPHFYAQFIGFSFVARHTREGKGRNLARCNVVVLGRGSLFRFGLRIRFFDVIYRRFDEAQPIDWTSVVSSRFGHDAVQQHVTIEWIVRQATQHVLFAQCVDRFFTRFQRQWIPRW